MKKLVRLAIVFLASVQVAVVFQNCGQPGQISLNNSNVVTAVPDPVTLIANPGVHIDGGADFTNSKQVMLQMTAVGAEEMKISNSSDCSSTVGWEKYSENKSWQIQEENKAARVYVVFRKKGAPETPCVSDEITHDNIAPELRVVSQPQSFTKETMAKLQYSILENGSGIKSLSCKDQLGTEAPCSEMYDFAGLEKEQMFSVSVTAVDKAGNISAPLMVAFTVDRTAPAITINGPSGAMALSQANFNLAVMDLNNVVKIECRLLPLESAFKDCSTLKADYANLVSGVYKLEVRAEDAAGNRGEKAQDFEVDLSVPTVVITKSPLAIGNIKNVSFEFSGLSGTRVISLFKCSLDNSVYTDCSSPQMYNNLIDKDYLFRVIGKNDVGTESAAAEYRFIVDTLAPEIKVLSSPVGVIKINSPQINLSATDINGIKSVECSLNGAAYVDCSNRTAVYANLSDGNYSFIARATDNAGNTAQTTAVNWTVDTTPDSTLIATLSQDPTLEGQPTQLQVQSTLVKNLSYSCLGQSTKTEILKGASALAAFNAPLLVNEDFACEVKGLDKNNLEIKRTVLGSVNCGNRIKEGGKCVDFKCTKFTRIDNLTSPAGQLLIPARSSAGECFTYKLFNSIANSSSKLTTIIDNEVMSRNHDGSNPYTKNPYVLGKALINFKLIGPRVVKLTGGATSLSPILVDNYVLSGIYPTQVSPLASHYSANGTKDSGVDSAGTHVLFKNEKIPLKSFGPGGTATVTPLEIVKEADTNLDYMLDVRALDCGGARELSEIYLIFQ